MTDIIREAPLGQVIRWISRSRLLRYPEEIEGFKIPWEGDFQTSEPGEKENESDTTPGTDVDVEKAGKSDARSDHPDLSRRATNRDTEYVTDRDAEEAQYASIIRTRTDASNRQYANIVRTKSREATTPWSEDRFEVEQQQSVERTKSSIIQPQQTSDGVILVDWYTTDDPDNPQNWSSGKKSYVVFLILVYTFVVYCASAIYTSSEPDVMAHFGVGQSKASLGLSLYVIGYGVGPLLFSPLSEVPLFGRNVPYMVSFGLFVILAVPTALVDNYAGLLVLRFLTGFMGSPCLATGGATMQDLYSLLKLPYALTAWVAASFCAPALGPLLSGFAVTAEGWRWSLWEILWMSGPVWLLWFLSMPETSTANILLRRAQRLRALTGNDKLRSQSEIDQGSKKFGRVVYEALLIPAIICVQDPAVLFTNIYSAVIYSTYYSFFEAFPLAYIGIYGFNLGELGVVFTCIIVGCVIGIIIYCSYQWFYLEPDIKKNGLREQEHRLVPALFAVWFLPIGLFWFGWTATASIHWIVSIIGITFFAAGAFVLFQCIFMYLPLTYPPYAASLFAANDFLRASMAAGSIIYAYPLYINLGLGRGVSILGGLMVGGGFGVIALWAFGKGLRARSRFALH